MCSITNTAHPYHVVIDYPAALSAVSRVVSVCRSAHPHSLEILDNSAGEKKPHQATRFFS
jgi:hypothetical protein